MVAKTELLIYSISYRLDMNQEIDYPKTLKNYCPMCEGITTKRLLPKEYQKDPDRVSYMCDNCVQGINFLKQGRFFN